MNSVEDESVNINSVFRAEYLSGIVTVKFRVFYDLDMKGSNHAF